MRAYPPPAPPLQGGEFWCADRERWRSPLTFKEEGLGGGLRCLSPSQLRLGSQAAKPSHLPPLKGREHSVYRSRKKTRSGASRFNARGNHEMRGAAGSHSSLRGPSHGQRPEVPPSKCMSRLVNAPALTKGQKAISREHSEWT